MCLTFSLMLSLKLLEMDSFQVLNLSDHALSRGRLVFEEPSEIGLLLGLLVVHRMVMGLETGVTLV